MFVVVIYDPNGPDKVVGPFWTSDYAREYAKANGGDVRVVQAPKEPAHA